jgi:hypothetical protein
MFFESFDHLAKAIHVARNFSLQNCNFPDPLSDWGDIRTAARLKSVRQLTGRLLGGNPPEATAARQRLSLN